MDNKFSFNGSAKDYTKNKKAMKMANNKKNYSSKSHSDR